MDTTLNESASESGGEVMGTFHSKWPSQLWNKVVDRIAPLVFRIYTGNSAGTGFVISVGSADSDEYHHAILATAWHVIEEAASNPIDVQIVSVDRTKVFDTHADRMHVQQIGEVVHDTGLIMLSTKKQIIEQRQLAPIMPFHLKLARGAEVGWLGFPGFVDPELCFFHGHVSGYLNEPPTYLIDGVAINGVSGGPVFDDRAHLIGLVSAYIPNRVDAQTTLPGLAALMPINAIRQFMEQKMNARSL
jgi:hypothetical protein